jgi:hypothetical protein
MPAGLETKFDAVVGTRGSMPPSSGRAADLETSAMKVR